MSGDVSTITVRDIAKNFGFEQFEAWSEGQRIDDDTHCTACNIVDCNNISVITSSGTHGTIQRRPTH